MRQLFAEFIGTFFLMLTVCLSVTAKDPTLAPLAIGLSLMVMVYSCGHISGGHLNPAVSIGAMLRGKLNAGETTLYATSQILAAIVAAGVALALKGGGPTPAAINAGAGIAGEMLGTFALVWVVLNVATSRGTQGNSFYGAAIGLTVTAAAVSVGGFSGGAFNPAVAIGGALFGLFRWADIWVPILGSVMGGAAAAFAFRAANPDDLRG